MKQKFRTKQGLQFDERIINKDKLKYTYLEIACIFFIGAILIAMML